MFDAIRRNKTLRSLLSAAALFSAGMPAAGESAEKSPTAVVETAKKQDISGLVNAYRPLCEIFEANLPYCYSDDGVKAIGMGVHLKDYAGFLDQEGIQVTFKDTVRLNRQTRKRLQYLADHWDDKDILSEFSNVSELKKIKLKEYTGSLPAGTATSWSGKKLVLVPTATLQNMNNVALNEDVQKALKVHPKLFELPFLAQIVVVDLVHNLGLNKYKRVFGEFQIGVNACDLQKMKAECGTKHDGEPDVRRNGMKKGLLTVQILISKNTKLSPVQLKAQAKNVAVAEDPKWDSVLEADAWTVVNGLIDTSIQEKKILPETKIMQRGSAEK